MRRKISMIMMSIVMIVGSNIPTSSIVATTTTTAIGLIRCTRFLAIGGVMRKIRAVSDAVKRRGAGGGCGWRSPGGTIGTTMMMMRRRGSRCNIGGIRWRMGF